MTSHQWRGEVSGRRPQQGGWSQASTMHTIILYDQHGREWTTQISNKSGMPTTLIMPSFQAPWLPDPSWLRVNPDNTAQMWIDYETPLRSRTIAWTEYHKRVREFCAAEKLPVPAKGAYSEDIKAALGKGPKPVEPLIAAIQENAWILGFTKVVDERLSRFVTPPTETEALLDQYDFRTAVQTVSNAPWDKVKRATAAAPAVRPDVAAIMDEAEAQAEAEAAFDIVEMEEQLEAEIDPAAMGGRTIAPEKTDIVARQMPRRETASPRRSRQGRHRSDAAKRQQGTRKTLADGAPPVVAGEGI